MCMLNENFKFDSSIQYGLTLSSLSLIVPQQSIIIRGDCRFPIVKKTKESKPLNKWEENNEN